MRIEQDCPPIGLYGVVIAGKSFVDVTKARGNLSIARRQPSGALDSFQSFLIISTMQLKESQQCMTVSNLRRQRLCAIIQCLGLCKGSIDIRSPAEPYLVQMAKR